MWKIELETKLDKVNELSAFFTFWRENYV